jgi:hypothetical protein
LKTLSIHRKGEIFLGQGGATLEVLSDLFQELFPEISPKYIDYLSLMAGIAAGRALVSAGSSLNDDIRREFAVVLGSAFGAVDSSQDFDHQALLKGPNTVNPMDFPNTVANAAGSRIGIWLGLRGPNITLTNGGTSFIDALGFAWEGLNGGLLNHCLVGAADKIPHSIKALAPSTRPDSFREGACLYWASCEGKADSLFEIVDYFAVQLGPDSSLPDGFLVRLNQLLEGVQWLGCPQDLPFQDRFPRGIPFSYTDETISELGLGGLDALDRFLTTTQSCGVIGAMSKNERKISLLKVLIKRKR